jgi:hypothetical protein
LLDKATAHKKYEAQFANQIWQSDMLFGPWVERPGGGKQQVFLQATLDDASRLIPHAQFYPNQGLDSFLDCLRQAIAARGIPTRLYMDNAKIYRSPQLARIAASIGILIVHTPPYQPEGRGKIERFFRSVREQFLASLDPKVLLSIEQFNERLWHWLDTVYHRHEHSALQTTPLLRWQRDIEQVRQLPPATDLRRLVLSSRGPVGAPRFHLPAEESFLRSALASGRQTHRSALRSARSHQLEIYSKASRKAWRGWWMRSSMGCCRPGKRRRSNHVGILFRLQENALFRQPRRQTTVRLPDLEPGQNAAGVSGAASRRGTAHRRSGRGQVHRRARVHRHAQ